MYTNNYLQREIKLRFKLFVIFRLGYFNLCEFYCNIELFLRILL